MKNIKNKRKQAIIRRRIFLSIVSLIMVAIIALVAFVIHSLTENDKTDNNSSLVSSENNNSSTTSSTVFQQKPTEKYATVLSTGDIMVHEKQLIGAKTTNGEYDFSAFFKEASPYFKKYNLSIANLEVTFGGTESGKYSGYPNFNTPDVLADTIKQSGLNLLLTANNHSYDTGLFGLKRTAQILNQKEIQFIGTREKETDTIYTVKNINGIKIGMADYTYETGDGNGGKKYLNGKLLSSEANNLISSFSYQNIEKFYTEAQTVISQMKSNGAEFIVFYIHWGNEYNNSPNTWQKTIAQKLSNLGVDIIIGSHPHVIQPIELIHSEDGQNTTVCLYSIGNAISNQRIEEMGSDCPTGHTEDGLFFTYTLRKSQDEVTLEDIDIIPTWVNRYKGGNGYLYTIYPLETADAGNVKYGLDSATSQKAANSYERTKKIVSNGLTVCQKAIGCEITFK